MMLAEVNETFWRGKKVFLTGHTGFKGGWLAFWLASMGAKVSGFALPPNTSPNLYDILGLEELLERPIFGDVRDYCDLERVVIESEPEVLIHMAAQPLVRFSYSNPIETYATNVMGTVHVLEAARKVDSLRSTVVVTTDKCYENREWVWGYRENEPMGGFDPYSSSKGCAELVTSSYRQSFFKANSEGLANAIATARAGNVIGGGDWSEDRLIPDSIKAFNSDRPLLIRNPMATRPWQHVLEPLSGYLVLAQALYAEGEKFASAWNFGPNDEDACSVQDVVEKLIGKWGGSARWLKDGLDQPHEANLLKLDCSKAKMQLGWVPKWNLEVALENTYQWYKAQKCGADMREITLEQIHKYRFEQ